MAEHIEVDALRRSLGATVGSADGSSMASPSVTGSDAPPSMSESSLAPRLTGGSPGPRFEFGAMLGVGATGQVYAVFDRDLQRTIAVKMLRHGAEPGDQDLLGLLEEARVTASLQHPNVLPVHDLGVDDAGRPCFSMSRIDGVTLGDVLSRSTTEARDAKIATPNAIVTIFIAICHALGYAHNRGLVHQDIKPDNILLGDFGEVLVLDWGSAARVGADGRTMSRLYGTPLYMSPEQARSEYSDARSDIYAIGAALFHALTLRQPTWSDDSDSFWDKKRRGVIDALEPAERALCPPELLSIAATALAPDPGKRYATVTDLARDLERYQAGLAVSVHREPLARMLLRWYRANRRIFWTAAAACVTVACMTAMMAVEKAKERTSWILVGREDFSGDIHAEWTGAYKEWTWPASRPISIDDAAFTREPGAMLMHSREGFVDLIHQRPVLGDLRVEWDYTSLFDGTNLNCFIEGKDRESGYTFHTGGFGLRDSVTLTKGTVVLQRRSMAPLSARSPHHFRMEKEGNRLLLVIDGVEVIDYSDLDPTDVPDDGLFGFDSTHALGNRVAAVGIWHKPLARRVSPIAFGRKLLEMQRYPQAYEQFLDILEAYPGSALEPEALYGMAVCRVREGKGDEAKALLDRFAASHAHHELMPYCLRERLSLASAADDARERQAALDGLAAFPGHPVLTSVANRLVDDEFARAIHPAGMRVDSGVKFPADAPERIAHAMTRLRGWLPAIGASYTETRFSRDAAKVLAWLGRSELVPEYFPEDSVICADALLATGRYEDVLATYPAMTFQAAHALLALGRLPELADSGNFHTLFRWEALLVMGKQDRALELFPRDAELRFELRRFDEALALAPGNKTLQCRVLIAQERFEEALPLAEPTWLKQSILEHLGRYDEAMAGSHDYDLVSYECAAFMILEDPSMRERGRELLSRLCRGQGDMDNYMVVFTRCFLPALTANRAGEQVDPRVAFTEVLEHGHLWGGQRAWYLAALVAGRIGEEEFLRQPYQIQVRARLHLARGLKAELARDWLAADAEYRECSLAEEPFGLGLTRAEHQYVSARRLEFAAGK